MGFRYTPSRWISKCRCGPVATPCLSYLGNGLTLPHRCAGGDQDLAAMGIQGGKTAAVIHHQIFAVAAALPTAVTVPSAKQPMSVPVSAAMSSP